jgi:hypothetical protein
MKYQMQEGYLTLGEGDWQDRTVNMLGANHLPVKGTNLVVTRESMPTGMGLADYLLNQKSILSKELTGFKILSENPDTVNGLPAHFLEFTWNNQGTTMHQMIFIINNTGSALNLTSTVPGTIDDESRATLITAMKSFTIGQAPLEKKEIRHG